MKPETRPSSRQRIALVIDNSKDRDRRRQRIDLLKQEGFKVFPARDLKTALPRALAGSFDLLIVHAADEPQQAMELCDSMRKQSGSVVLLIDESGEHKNRDYTIGGDARSLCDRVRALFGTEAAARDLVTAA